ncbi:unnamed protein product [Leuciscus chuanchicus]
MEERMLEMWQQYECLFNVSSKEYHNRSDKEKSWGEIASDLNVPVEEVKTRATTLRTQYTKLLKPKPSGSVEKGLTHKQAWLLRNLEFLKKHVAQRPSETSLDQSVKDLIDGQDMDDPTSDEDIINTSEAPGVKNSPPLFPLPNRDRNVTKGMQILLSDRNFICSSKLLQFLPLQILTVPLDIKLLWNLN